MSVLVITDKSPNNVNINNRFSTVTISNMSGPQGIQGPAGGVNSINGEQGDLILSTVDGTGIDSSVNGLEITINNTAPDQIVSITGGSGIDVTGTYPNFTVDSTVSQYTDEQAQDAVGNILTDTSTVDLVYNDVSNTITANVLTSGLDVMVGATASTAGVKGLVPAAPIDTGISNNLPRYLASDGTFRYPRIGVGDDGVFVGSATSLNFTGGATVTDIGSGVIQVDVAGGGGSGTVTSVSAYRGIETIDGNPITSTGTVRASEFPVNLSSGTTLTDQNRGQLIEITDSSPSTLNLVASVDTTSPNLFSVQKGWFIDIFNNGSSTLTVNAPFGTVTPGDINGSSNFVISSGNSARFVATGGGSATGGGTTIGGSYRAISYEKGTNYNISSGLTLTGSTLTNDYATGKSGGQTIFGGTGDDENLTLASTTASMKGNIYFGQAQNAWYDADQQYFQVNTNGAGITQTLTSGTWYQNSTASTSVLQQISPSVVFEGQGWSSTSTASRPVRFQQYVLPILGTTNPSANFLIQSSINGAAFTNAMTLTSAGALTATSFISTTATGFGFTSSSTSTNANFAVVGSSASTTTTAAFLFSGATTVAFRIIERGSTAATLTAGLSYASRIQGTQAVVTANTGNSALIAGNVWKPVTITVTAGSTVTNTATHYIEAAATATVSGVNYAIWSAAGVNRFGGSIVNDTLIGTGTRLVSADATGQLVVTAPDLSNATNLSLATGVSGTLAIANGGTGQTTASNAFTALSPSQVNKGVLTSNGTSSSFSLTDLNTNNLLFIQDQKSAGTDGGSIVAATWVQKVINTIVLNNITGSGLSGNQIQLPAGTYFINARSPVVAVDRHKARLQNITDATTTVIGSSAFCTSGMQTDSLVRGYFTIAATKVFELQHYAQTANGNTFGRGFSSSSGLTDIYSEVQIWKVG